MLIAGIDLSKYNNNVFFLFLKVDVREKARDTPALHGALS